MKVKVFQSIFAIFFSLSAFSQINLQTLETKATFKTSIGVRYLDQQKIEALLPDGLSLSNSLIQESLYPIFYSIGSQQNLQATAEGIQGDYINIKKYNELMIIIPKVTIDQLENNRHFSYFKKVYLDRQSATTTGRLLYGLNKKLGYIVNGWDGLVQVFEEFIGHPQNGPFIDRLVFQAQIKTNPGSQISPEQLSHFKSFFPESGAIVGQSSNMFKNQFGDFTCARFEWSRSPGTPLTPLIFRAKITDKFKIKQLSSPRAIRLGTTRLPSFRISYDWIMGPPTDCKDLL